MDASWEVWELNHVTIGWIVLIVAFFVWEGYSIVVHPGSELTWHLRPVFASYPLTWWLGFALWAWLGIHFLAWRWEQRMLEFLVGV